MSKERIYIAFSRIPKTRVGLGPLEFLPASYHASIHYIHSVDGVERHDVIEALPQWHPPNEAWETSRETSSINVSQHLIRATFLGVLNQRPFLGEERKTSVRRPYAVSGAPRRDALPVQGPMRRVHRLVGPGSAEQRKGRRTAFGIRGPAMAAHSKSVSSSRMIRGSGLGA
jgi:hypothetical protein